MAEEKGLEEIETLDTTEQPKEQESKATETQNNDTLFNVSDPNELPEDLRGIYSNWQKSYTEKRQSERQELRNKEEALNKLAQENAALKNTADQFNQLINSPAFVDWAKQQVQGSGASQDYEPAINYDEFEEPDAVKQLLSEMRSVVRYEVAQAMQPVMQTFATTKEQQEFSALAAMAKRDQLPDPMQLQREIQVIRASNPGLSLTTAYEIAAFRSNRSGLGTRPAVNTTDIEEIKKEIPTTGGRSITNPPVTSRFRERGIDSSEALDKLIADKKANKETRTPITSILRNVLKERGMDERDL